jgi:hypothetical protein
VFSPSDLRRQRRDVWTTRWSASVRKAKLCDLGQTHGMVHDADTGAVARALVERGRGLRVIRPRRTPLASDPDIVPTEPIEDPTIVATYATSVGPATSCRAVPKAFSCRSAALSLCVQLPRCLEGLLHRLSCFTAARR